MSNLSQNAFIPITVGGHLLVSSRFHVTCQQCEHERTLDLISLKRRYGPRTLMADVLDRLVCEACRGRDYLVSANGFAPEAYCAANHRAATRSYWWQA